MMRERRAAIGFLILAGGVSLAIFMTRFRSSVYPSNMAQTIVIDDFINIGADDGRLPDAVNQLFANPRSTESARAAEPAEDIWESRKYRVIFKGTAGSAMAVIQDMDSGQEHVVRPGDRLGDARITAIERNYLELDGPLGRAVLRLPGEDHLNAREADSGDSEGSAGTSGFAKSSRFSESSGSAGSPGSAGSSGSAETSRFAGSARDSFPSTDANKRGSGSATDPAGNLQIIDRAIFRDLVTRVDALSSEITLQPVRDADGAPAGFKISMLKPQGLLAQMGLRRDDMLTAVNHRNIQTIEDAFRILESAGHQNSLTLSIQRNQQKMELNYVIR